MKTYTLVIDDRSYTHPVKIEIEISDPKALFDIVEKRVTGRAAHLWDGSDYIGEVIRSDHGFWRLSKTSHRGWDISKSQSIH
jgi:hypothetical protein